MIPRNDSGQITPNTVVILLVVILVVVLLMWFGVKSP